MSPPMISTLCLEMCQVKKKSPIVEDGDIRFITGIGGIVVRDDCCSGVAIKCNAYNSRMGII